MARLRVGATAVREHVAAFVAFARTLGQWRAGEDASALDFVRSLCWHDQCILLRAMSPWLRALLWVLVVVAPGGVLLLPLIAADSLRQRNRVAATATTP